MKRILLSAAAALLFAAAASAQSSEKITELINTKETTYGQAAYLAAVYVNAIKEDAGEQDALTFWQQAEVFSEKIKPEDKISLADLSFMCATAGKLKGGLFYTLMPGPRYAFRELKAKGIIPPSADPSVKVSGRDAIAVLNGCVSETETSE